MTNEELIAKIKVEIERLYDGEAPKHDQQCDFDDGYFTGIDAISQFLDALESEKLMNLEGLDQEIIKCWQEWISPSNKQSVEGVLPLSEFAFYARHFAQWGAEHAREQMMNEAVEKSVSLVPSTEPGKLLEPFVGLSSDELQGCVLGDVVRVIVLKKEDEK